MEPTPNHYAVVALRRPEKPTRIPSAEAMEHIRESRVDPPKLAERWGITLKQVFDIQDGIE
jgi:hypothetical protein